MGHRARMSGKVVEVWLAVVVLTGLLLAAPMAGTPVQGASADVVYASANWADMNSIGNLCVAQSGNGPDTQTFLHYAIWTQLGFHEGYGYIVHQDLKGSVKGRLNLDTHTSRISGGVTGNTGAVNVIWQGDSVRGNIVGFDLAGASSFRGSAAASSLAAYCQ